MQRTLCFLSLCIATVLIDPVHGSSCPIVAGKIICNGRNCPRKLQCKGNHGKDECNCCTICLKQENERCGGNNGKCDHHVPYCVKLKGEKYEKCISLKTALINDVEPYVSQVLRITCKDGKEEKESVKKLLQCVLGPARFFCRKEPTYYAPKDCCLKKNHCNPDPKVYEVLDTIPLLQRGF